MAERRRRFLLRRDTGDARTWTLASLVGVMIVAGVVALVLVAADSGGSSGGRPSRQVEAKGPTHRAGASNTGSAPASSTPADTSTPQASSSPVSRSSSTSPSTHRAPSTHAARPKPAKRVVYTVKRGDNLSVIAWWFHEHGFGAIYERNKQVIGSNPNLIFPGQKIIISGGSMSMGG